MKPHAALRVGSIVLLAVLAAACGRKDVTAYEPGVYKGPKDPLLATHGAPEHKAKLQERFTMSQSDR